VKSKKVGSIKGANDFSVVGIGASAGGLDPIRKLLENLPVDMGMAFVVIQHLAPGQDSLLPEILSRSTKMKVQQVQDGMQVEQDNVYVITPATTMTLKNGQLRLVPKGLALKPINDFMVSLASEKKTRAIGIVLSGTGNDGTEGLKAIKVDGGITFAQDPETAQYPDMPKNAIAAETPDFVLSSEQIARELLRIAKHPLPIHSETEKAPEQEKVETDLKKIIMLLKISFGVDFAHYRETTIDRRITRRMVINKSENMKEYVEYLRKHPNELQSLFDDLLIGVTSYFREPDTFVALKEKVLPELVKKRPPNESIRVWIPGCSTGEEVYSFAITIQEYLEEKAIPELRVQIFGTDANEKNIEKSRQGTYPKNIEDNVSENRLKRFFTFSSGHYQITKSIRDMCIFAKQDITTDPPFSNIDLIMCRNVLIYFDSYLHERVLRIFHYGLKSNGFLVLGESESVGKFQYLFEPISPGGLIYRKKQAPPQVLTNDVFAPNVAKKTAEPIGKTDLLAVLGEKVDHLITSEYGPATLLVNSNLDIIVFRGDVAPFLSPESGVASLNVTKIVRKELRSQVQTALYRAKKEKTAIKETVFFKQKGTQKIVNIEIRPLETAQYEEPFYLVLFTEGISGGASLTKAVESVVLSGGAEGLKDRQIRELGEDLDATKRSLQSLVEGQQATNEELRSSMEEVQSSNEELQSTNEELETAKEELQSGNEELQTLNEELKNRNQTLGRLNDDLANLQTNIDLPVVIVDNELKIRRFTVSAQKLLKISPSDVGRSITDFNLGVHDVDLGKTISNVTTKLTAVTQEVVCAEDRLCEMQVRPYLTEAKKIDGAVVSFTDITERKKAEEQLVESEEKYRALVETADDVILLTDLKGQHIFRNKAYFTSLGYKVGEEITSNGFANVHPEDIPDIKAKMIELLKQGSATSEYRVRHKDGSWVYRFAKSTVIYDQAHKPKAIMAIIRDITERKKAEQALRESEEEFRSLFANMVDGFAYCRMIFSDKVKPVDFVYLQINDAFEKITGLKRELVIGKKVTEAIPGTEKANPELFEIYGRVALTGKSENFEVFFKPLALWLHVSVYCPRKEYFVAMFEDISNRKKMEAELEEYSKHLENLVEDRTKQLKDSERLAAIGATAGMVGHDIRNPLQAITSDVYLAKNELVSIPESEEKMSALESLQEIEKNVDYINKIVSDLQDYAKPLTPTLEEVDLESIAHSALATLNIPKNITVANFIRKDFPKLKTDHSYVQRILANLSNNAIQAMPKGGTLTIAATSKNGKATITVQDTGEGIPENVRNKIFTPLVTTKAKGQGFGLSVVKRFTEALGGTATFESEVGKGTKFIIELPI
jgi:two-component system, chemotaxis family, CheB/CheR fusion protein